MKIKLYDAGKKYEGYFDRYSLFFPIPAFKQQEQRKLGVEPSRIIRAMYLGCSPSSDGMIRCSWGTILRGQRINSEELYLGKRVSIDSMPKPFQKCVRNMIKVYEQAIKYNDQKHWEKWERI